MKPLPIIVLLALALNLSAQDKLDRALPVRGLCLGAPSPRQLDRFVQFINEDLAPRRVNTLILSVNYNYQFTNHPEVGSANGLSLADAKKIVAACRKNNIRLIPQIDLLGHQSWAGSLGNLLKAHPEFDETPWVKMPEKYAWPNADKLYCKSYCPLHPGVHEVLFGLIDELCDAFETDAFHAGMDEVFYIGEDKCPLCSGKDKGQLFAGEVKRLRDHLAEKGRKLWIWGDRLLDGKTTGLGEWEASMNGTYTAIDLIPKDVVICDWHYDRADQTAIYFATKGLQVVSCPWKNPTTAVWQVDDMARFRERSDRVMKDRLLGIVQTVWSGGGSFLNDYDKIKNGGTNQPNQKSEAECFVKTFEEIATVGNSSAMPLPPKSGD